MQISNQISDAELFSLLPEDNHAAYNEIYKRYSRLLYLHAYKKLGSREEARDLVQDLFTKIWVKRYEIVIRTAPSIYLYTALRNHILDHIAHKNVASSYITHIQDTLIKQEELTDHLIRHKQLQELIDAEIAALPLKMRRVFELSRKNQLSHKEIALATGISEKTVRKQIQNALKIMRPKLGLVLAVLFFLEK